MVKHKSKYSCESAIYFDLNSATIKENCRFSSTVTKQKSLLLYYAVGIKSSWQIGQVITTLYATLTAIYQSGYPVTHMY